MLELLLHNKVEQVQLHALRVMQALADDDEGQQAINAAGAAFWLSRLAYSGDAGIREAVSGTLCSLATQASEAPSLVAAGALAPIVAMLRDGSRGTQERALVALEKLTEAGGGGELAAVGAGALPPLVTFLRSGHPQGQAAAMHVMHNLAASSDTQQVVGKEAGAIAACVLALQRSREAEVVAHAAAALARLAEGGHRVAIVQAGGVEPLTLVLRTGGEAGRLAAVRAIASLALEVISHAMANPNPNPNPNPNLNPNPNPEPEPAPEPNPNLNPGPDPHQAVRIHSWEGDEQGLYALREQERQIHN